MQWVLYKLRHKIKNLFCKIKENRRPMMRVDKLDSSFMRFIILNLIKIEVC